MFLVHLFQKKIIWLVSDDDEKKWHKSIFDLKKEKNLFGAVFRKRKLGRYK